MDNKTKAKRAVNHLNQVCQWITEELHFAGFKIDAKIDTSFLDEVIATGDIYNLPYGEQKAQLNCGSEPEFRGRLYRPNVATAINILNEAYKGNNSLINVMKPTQGGKTTDMLCFSSLLPAVYKHYKPTAKVGMLYFLPPDNGLYDQFFETYKNFYNIYGTIQLVSAKNNRPVLLNRFLPAPEKNLHSSFVEKEDIRSVTFKVCLKQEEIVDKINRFDKDTELYLNQDEFGLGSGKNQKSSIITAIAMQEAQINAWANGYKNINHIGYSATSYEQDLSRDFVTIRGYIGPEYHGFYGDGNGGFYNVVHDDGTRVPANKCKYVSQPEICLVDDYVDKKFLIEKKKQNILNPKSVGLHNLLENVLKIIGEDKVIILRSPECSNDFAEKLADEIEKYHCNDDERVFRWFGKHLKNRNKKDIKTILAQEKTTNPKRVKIILVTAKARMGDDLPENITALIDLSENISTGSALIQGLPGRNGYGKKNRIFLYAKNVKVLTTFADTGYLEKKKTNNTKIHRDTSKNYLDVTDTIAIKKFSQYFIDYPAEYAQRKSVAKVAGVDAHIRDWNKSHKQHKIGEGGVQLQGPMIEKIKEILNKDFFDRIERKTGKPILRPDYITCDVDKKETVSGWKYDQKNPFSQTILPTFTWSPASKADHGHYRLVLRLDYKAGTFVEFRLPLRNIPEEKSYSRHELSDSSSASNSFRNEITQTPHVLDTVPKDGSYVPLKLIK